MPMAEKVIFQFFHVLVVVYLRHLCTNITVFPLYKKVDIHTLYSIALFQGY